MVNDLDYITLTRVEIAGSAIGTNPKAIAAFESLQEAAYMSGPAATQEAQATADQGVADAAAAQAMADSASTDAASALSVATGAATAAAAAQATADTKVTKDATPTWGAPSGAASRSVSAYTAPTISAAYSQTEVQALADAVQALSRNIVALTTDLRANHALKP